MKQVIIKKKILGFSALELMLGLLTLTFIMFTANQMLLQMAKKREYDQIADQSKMFGYIAIKYLNQNYQGLISQSGSFPLAMDFKSISDYIPYGTESSSFNRYYQTPCLYISISPYSRSQLGAYLVFAGHDGRAPSLGMLQALKISQIIGENGAIIMKRNDGQFIIAKSVNESGIEIPTQGVNQLYAQCGYTQGALLKNPLVVDLTNNPQFFPQMKNFTYDPSQLLKKNGDENQRTMQTNLYLDNVSSESSNPNAVIHNYNAIDFGVSTTESDKRMQIRAHDQNATTTNAGSSQLDVNNVGLQAGYIAPNSHLIHPLDTCDKSELGKIAQQQNSDILAVGGQLQCTYNPMFCDNNTSYCYLPTKNASFLLKYSIPVSQGYCPAGTMVDDDQKLGSTITCPEGLSLIEQKLNCQYKLGGEFCYSLQAVCKQPNGGFPPDNRVLPALTGLKCTTMVSTFVVDNYRPK